METLSAVEHILSTTAQSEISHSLSGLRLLEAGESSTAFKNELDRKEPELNQSLTAQFEATHTLTEVQLLDALADRISQERYTLNFDYFSFHVRCMHLLQTVYLEVSPFRQSQFGLLPCSVHRPGSKASRLGSSMILESMLLPKHYKPDLVFSAVQTRDRCEVR